jgi:hypothetical protein
MKVKLTIPTELKDIKLSQYQKFIKTTKDSEDSNFIARQMVAIFCGISDELVDSIKAKDYESIVSDISKVLEEKPKLVERFKMSGIEYGFIPDLEEITVGEKADLDNNIKDVKDFHKAMAVLYRPIVLKQGKTYQIEDYTGKEKPLDVTLDVAFGANVFFLTLMNDLLNSTLNFIENQAVHNQKVSQLLEKNGIGIAQSMHSLRETYNILKM